MAESIQEERWRWLKPIINNEMKLVDVEKVCPHSVRSLKRWKQAYEENGMVGLSPKSTRPNTAPEETPIRVKEDVIALRKKTGLCAQKLHWRLKRQGVAVPVRTIGKILKDEGLVRTYRVKKTRYKYLKAGSQASSSRSMSSTSLVLCKAVNTINIPPLIRQVDGAASRYSTESVPIMRSRS